ncbi:unnamed protein product [Durusdinium trenchii]|uniref:Chloroplastic n=3 Tax=Durusdinium trenchii TaxID=1381693 RepID=A0ABP0M8B5_9DINO
MFDVERRIGDSVGLQVQKAWYLLQAAKHSGLRPELWKATHVVRQAAQSLQWMDALDLTEFLADKGYAFHEDLRQSKVLVHSLAGRWTFCLQDLEKIQSDRYLRVQPLARTMRAGVSADAWPTVLQLLQCVATDTSQLRRGATAKRRTLLNVALSAFAAARDRQEPLLEQALSEAYAKTSLPWIRANDLMKNIKVTSLRPSRRSWNLVLAAGARNSTWRATCDMVRRRAAEGVRMDDMALEKLLKALSLSQAWPMASWILEDQLHQLRFARHSKRLSRAALQAAAARAAEEWCVVRPAPFQRQSWVKALCLMEARGTACVSQRAVLEGMLAACARTMETSRAIKLLQSAYARSVQVSGAAHSFAMHAAALKSRWGLSLMLYDDLRHSGSRPTDVTINNLAIAFRHLPRKWASAGLLFQEIQAQALRLNAIFLGNAVRGSSSSRQWQEAVELCRVTRVVQLRCDAYVFNNAMSGMGRLAQWRQTLQFMEEARETQVFTSDPTLLNSALSGMAAASQRGLATQLLQDLKRSDVRIDVISMGSLAKAFEHESLWTSVLSTLDALRHHDLTLNPIVWSTCASSCRRQSLWHWSLQILQEHQMKALKVEESTYCLSVHACGENTAWRGAIFLIETMRSARLRISELLYQNLPGIFLQPRRLTR